uniref:ADP-ribosylation factor-like protein 15 n=1 Tax=Eptatretus burgeri TaxID=7764 RepID=A0A8C4R7A8_EPTBU
MSECARVIISCCRIALHSCYQVLCCKDPPASCLEYDILCIGLTNAGKSTLLCQLLDENTNKVTPTSGFNIRAVQFEKAILNVKELGGGEGIRKYWSRYYQGSQGVIFVLDSASNEEDLEEARLELHCALQHPQLCTLPFLIFANHQDKLDARSIPEDCGRAGAEWKRTLWKGGNTNSRV